MEMSLEEQILRLKLDLYNTQALLYQEQIKNLQYVFDSTKLELEKLKEKEKDDVRET